jgi:hypothetical protein
MTEGIKREIEAERRSSDNILSRHIAIQGQSQLVSDMAIIIRSPVTSAARRGAEMRNSLLQFWIVGDHATVCRAVRVK